MGEGRFDAAFLQRVEGLHQAGRRIREGQARAFRRRRKLGHGLDVRDFRTYVTGDDLRHVDWNYYASSRELLVRLFEEEEDLHIWLLVDVSRSMQVGDGALLTQACRLAGALGYLGLANLDRVGVALFHDAIHEALPPSRGRSQLWKLLRFLDRPMPSGGTSLERTLQGFVRQRPRRGVAVVLSDFLDAGAMEQGLNLLRWHRMEPLLIQLTDNRDADVDLEGELDLVDCETGQRVPVTMTPGVRAAYRAERDAWQQRVAAWATGRQLLHLQVDARAPLEDAVLRIFRAGGFVR
jgi:uncharacterized protein (DUF58 family)